MVARVTFGLLFIAVSFLFLFFSESEFFAQDRSSQDSSSKQAHSEQPDYLKVMLGVAIEPAKQPFEDHIAALTFVSLDNIKRGIGFLEIDIAERKKLFSEEAWSEYQNFVSSQKNLLSSKKDQYEHPQAYARFRYGTQTYETKEGQHKFTSEINFCFSSSDSYDCKNDKYILEVYTEGAFESPSHMIIHSWRLQAVGAK